MTDGGARVVYTAIVGGYEDLLEQPVARGSSVDFVCLTDDPSLRSDDWEVRLIDPALPADGIRSSRAVKIIGHPSLAAYAETLWIDNRVRLHVDPDELLGAWLDGHDLALPRHSFRADVVSEFQAVLDQGLDDSSRLYEQLTHYSALNPALLRDPVPWTGMLARRRSPEVDAAMAHWLQHVLRYSRRDQLSFVQAMHEAGVTWSSVDVSNVDSALHEWRPAAGRSTRRMAFQVAESLQPPDRSPGRAAALLRADRQRPGGSRTQPGTDDRPAGERPLRRSRGRAAAAGARKAAQRRAGRATSRGRPRTARAEAPSPEGPPREAKTPARGGAAPDVDPVETLAARRRAASEAPMSRQSARVGATPSRRFRTAAEV